MRLYFRLVRLHRPIGTLLLLWPTLWALVLASDRWPDGYTLFAFCLGTLLMRSAGCAINDFADRDFDRHVARTTDRPVTSGRIRPGEAVAVFCFLCLSALPLLLPFNTLTWSLAVVAVLLAASYPFTKRFLAVPQAYLGVAFGFGIPMAFAAIQGSVPPLAWWLLGANITWAVAYDTEYAMVDRDDDLKIGIRTSAITFGRFDVTLVMVCYIITLALLWAVGQMVAAGPAYLFGLGLAGAMAIHHFTLIRHRSREGCFRAFNLNNWFGAAIFAGIVVDRLLER